jgi:hypothetical protein
MFAGSAQLASQLGNNPALIIIGFGRNRRQADRQGAALETDGDQLAAGDLDPVQYRTDV